MNDRNYRKYSEEFKLEALELLQRGDKSAGQIERELGIPPGVGYKGLVISSINRDLASGLRARFFD